MVKSMFAGVAGLKAHQQKMDVIGNNIANCNTIAFKSSSVTFKDAMYQTVTGASGGTATNNMYGGQNPSQVGYGSMVGGISSLFTTGGVAADADNLHCMIDGSAFFMVGPFNDKGIPIGDVTKSSTINLSRAGLFSVDENGYLVDDQKNYVYGFANKNDATQTPDMDKTQLLPLRIPYNGNNAVHNIVSYSIKSDGTIIGTTSGEKPDGSGDPDVSTVTIGQVAIATVQNPNGLERTAGYYYKASENTGTVTVNEAGGTAGQIIGNATELANVDLAKEFSDMITTQRGFQANSKIITVTDQMLEELVNLKR